MTRFPIFDPSLIAEESEDFQEGYERGFFEGCMAMAWEFELVKSHGPQLTPEASADYWDNKCAELLKQWQESVPDQ